MGSSKVQNNTIDVSRVNDIAFLQATILYMYSQRYRLPLKSVSELFSQYNIFKFLNECYDLLHLYGNETILSKVHDRIKGGVVF